jgi:serine protease Do
VPPIIKSPAEKAGIKQGDVITEVEGKKVTTVAEINAIKNKKKIGDTLTIKVYREGSYIDIKVVLEEAK